MSYREENGQVILAMTREDYQRLLLFMGYATGASLHLGSPLTPLPQVLEFLNRLNEGNPNYAPYEIRTGDASGGARKRRGKH